MKTTRITATALLATTFLAGCGMFGGGGEDRVTVQAGLSYEDFQRQYNVDEPTLRAIDANSDGVISEPEWQAAGY